MQNQEKIIQAIAAYLEENTSASGYYEEVQFSRLGGRANHAGFCQAVAVEIVAAIAQHLESGAGKNEAISVGQKVRIIALLDHGSQDGHSLPIGHVGSVQEIDTNDSDLTYRLNGHNEWVSRGEIEVVE